MTGHVTLRLDSDIQTRLDKLAKATDRSCAALAAEAVRQFIDLNERQIAAIQDGLRDAEHRRLIDHARLKAKWDKRLAFASDTAG